VLTHARVQGIRAPTRRQAYERIAFAKLSISIERLCAGQPRQLVDYFRYVRTLKFEDAPDYTYLRRLLRDLFVSRGHTWDYVYDWTLPQGAVDAVAPGLSRSRTPAIAAEATRAVAPAVGAKGAAAAADERPSGSGSEDASANDTVQLISACPGREDDGAVGSSGLVAGAALASKGSTATLARLDSSRSRFDSAPVAVLVTRPAGACSPDAAAASAGGS
jgi:casein kinase 1